MRVNPASYKAAKSGRDRIRYAVQP